MSRVVIYDPGHENERVLQDLPSVNTPDYTDRVGVDAVINPDTSGNVEPILYWRHDAGAIRDMNQTEKDALDLEIANAALAAARDGAKAGIDLSGQEGVKLRAVVELMIREINILRAEHAFADRTLAQARAAYLALIDEGAADG